PRPLYKLHSARQPLPLYSRHLTVNLAGNVLHLHPFSGPSPLAAILPLSRADIHHLSCSAKDDTKTYHCCALPIGSAHPSATNAGAWANVWFRFSSFCFSLTFSATHFKQIRFASFTAMPLIN